MRAEGHKTADNSINQRPSGQRGGRTYNSAQISWNMREWGSLRESHVPHISSVYFTVNIPMFQCLPTTY